MSQAEKTPGRRLRIKDKTLVAWVTLANLDQCGGNVLALYNSRDQFDALVLGEIHPRKWWAGSERQSRTLVRKDVYADESAGPDKVLQMAITYRGRRVTLYRDGAEYAAYDVAGEPAVFDDKSMVLMGHRLWAGPFFEGSILDARIYSCALKQAELAALRPGRASRVRPCAWWCFSDGKLQDRMGTFPRSGTEGYIGIQDGRLTTGGGTGVAWAMRDARGRKRFAAQPGQEGGPARVLSLEAVAARELRERMLSDAYRPTYHFVIPEDCAGPFDPNGAVYWNGRYHLGYLYQDKGVHCWGHVSSHDLLHWRHHRPWVVPTSDSPEHGIFSGNCFINRDGAATMLYHGLGAGNCISISRDPQLDRWQKLKGNPVVPNPPPGNDPYLPGHLPYASWDPHGWLDGDTHYAIFGGSRPAIFKAKRLDRWTYVGDLFAHALDGVDIREDVSCPDLFRLGNRHVLVCISHRLGCRYYIGTWKNEKFYPEFHERMSWADNAFFAPESLEDARGRRILWAWIFDGRNESTRRASGWSGFLSLPRVLTLDGRRRLRMGPIEELAQLRCNPRARDGLRLRSGQPAAIPEVSGNTLEIEVELDAGGATRAGLEICRSPNGAERTLVYYDWAEQKLKVDTTHSGLEQGVPIVEAAPLELAPNETLKMRVFVDKSLVEVFANGRQAVARCICPSRPDSLGVRAFSEGGAAMVRCLRAWDMMPSNPY